MKHIWERALHFWWLLRCVYTVHFLWLFYKTDPPWLSQESIFFIFSHCSIICTNTFSRLSHLVFTCLIMNFQESAVYSVAWLNSILLASDFPNHPCRSDTKASRSMDCWRELSSLLYALLAACIGQVPTEISEWLPLLPNSSIISWWTYGWHLIHPSRCLGGFSALDDSSSRNHRNVLLILMLDTGRQTVIQNKM